MDRPAVDAERPYAGGHQRACFDNAAHGHDGEPAAGLDAALGGQLR